MLTDHEQQIYNEHLRTSRVSAGKPYKLRKDFSDIDPSIELYVKRVGRLLHKFKHISTTDYFEAPYKVYGDDNRFDLKFYTSPRALKAYTLYMQQEVCTDPDTPAVLQRVAKALQYLSNFCKSHQIHVDDYAQHTTNNFPTFLMHLKERKLTPHIMIELHNTLSIIRCQEKDIMTFMFGENFYDNINTYKTKYLLSTTCKALVRAGINIIKQHNKNQNTIQ